MSHLLVLTFSSVAVVAPKSWIMKKKEWFRLEEVNIPAAVNSGFKNHSTCWKQTDPAESQVRSKWQKYLCKSIHWVWGEWLSYGLLLVIYLFLPGLSHPHPHPDALNCCILNSTSADQLIPSFSSFNKTVLIYEDCCFCSITKLCPPLCNPMDCGMPEFAQIHVHWRGDAIQPSHPLSSLSLPAFILPQHQVLVQWVSSLHQVAKVLEFQLQHQSFQWIFRTGFL